MRPSLTNMQCQFHTNALTWWMTTFRQYVATLCRLLRWIMCSTWQAGRERTLENSGHTLDSSVKREEWRDGCCSEPTLKDNKWNGIIVTSFLRSIMLHMRVNKQRLGLKISYQIEIPLLKISPSRPYQPQVPILTKVNIYYYYIFW